MADEKEQPRQNQLNIEISEEIADGIYSNLAIITHSNSEFVLDFVTILRNSSWKCVTRLVLLVGASAV